MKKFNIIILFFCLLFGFSLSIEANASSGDLDRISLYQITVDPRDDGTLDINFKITWTVLNSSDEGPLEWVKIGIPNYHVDELKAYTSNIKKIKYYTDSGSFIRLDFDRKYYAKETLTFEFSIHQSYMYHLTKINGVDSCVFDYSPGWFDEIVVDRAIVLWKAENIKKINDTFKLVDDYYQYESSLNHGETIQARVVYDASNFINLDENMQYTNEYLSPEEKRNIAFTVFCIVLIFVGMITVVSIYTRKNADQYLSNRGFCFHHHYWFYRPHRRYYGNGVDKKGARIVNPVTPSSGSGGHGGSCACACACAGGGRAGCSRKDFYDKELKFKKIKEALKNNK